MSDHMDHLADPGPLIPAGRRHAFLVEARELLRLGIPLAATQLAQMIILATDTVMLGHFSKEALAAAALGNTVYFLVWLLGSGLPMAVSPVIAHAQGHHAASTKPRDRREVRIAVRMGLWSVALIFIPLLAVLIFTRPILKGFGQQPQLAADAAIFVSGLIWGLPFAIAFQVLRSFSTALSRAVPPLMVMGLAILWNAGFDYALIFGHFGFPSLGLYGAGLASASSNIFSFVAMLAICLWQPALRRYHILHRLWQPHWTSFRRTVPPGAADRHHHGVRSGAVQWRRTCDGHFRHRLAGGAPDRHHDTLPHLHDPAGHRAGRHRAGGHGGGRGRRHRGAARRLHRHRHGGPLHVLYRAGAAAMAARNRQPLAARHRRKMPTCWRWPSPSCMSPPLFS